MAPAKSRHEIHGRIDFAAEGQTSWKEFYFALESCGERNAAESGNFSTAPLAFLALSLEAAHALDRGETILIVVFAKGSG